MSADVLEQAFGSTAAIVAKVTPDHLDLPTPCSSWKVSDLLDHIVGGSAWFGTMVSGDESAGGAAPPLDPATLSSTYAANAAGTLAAFRADGAMGKMLTLPFGEIPGAAFVMIAATDTFIHGWDLAKAIGAPTDLDPALASSLLGAAKVSIPEGFRGPEPAPFGPEIPISEDAHPADKLAAFLGRTV